LQKIKKQKGIIMSEAKETKGLFRYDISHENLFPSILNIWELGHSNFFKLSIRIIGIFTNSED
jgi:hypothetical protein